VQNEAMSLRPHAIAAVPEATARVAQAAFPRGTIYMTMRDEWATLYEEADFPARLTHHFRFDQYPLVFMLVSCLSVGIFGLVYSISVHPQEKVYSARVQGVCAGSLRGN
jgi:transposase